MVKGSCMFMEEFLLATWLFVFCDLGINCTSHTFSCKADGRVIFHQHVSDASYMNMVSCGICS